MQHQDHIMLNIRDWRDATSKLSKRLKGAYIDFLCEYYRHGGPIPYGSDKQVQDLCTDMNYKNVRGLLKDIGDLIEAGKIYSLETPNGIVLVNDRADQEIAYYRAKREGNILGGKTSRRGAPRQPEKAVGDVIPEDILRKLVEFQAAQFMAFMNPTQPTQNDISGPVMGGDNQGISGLPTAPETEQHSFQNQLSDRNQPDINSISTRYQVENDIKIEQNQGLSDSSFSKYNSSREGACAPAHVSPPEHTPTCAPAREPPSTPPSPAVPAARQDLPAGRRFRLPGEKVESQTEEQKAEALALAERKQFRIDLAAKIQAMLDAAGVWDDIRAKGRSISSQDVATWLHMEADPEDHILPAVEDKIAQMQKSGEKIFSSKFFDEGIAKRVKAESEIGSRAAKALAAAPSPKGGQGKPGRKNTIPERIAEVVRMAYENEWKAEYDELVGLYGTVVDGDPESLRKLNQLADTYREKVRSKPPAEYGRVKRILPIAS